MPEGHHNWFNARGIDDVNNGKFYFDLPKGRHRYRRCNGIHTKKSPLGKPWNQVWDEWIGRHPYAGPDEILAQLNKMAKDAGIDYYRAIPKK